MKLRWDGVKRPGPGRKWIAASMYGTPADIASVAIFLLDVRKSGYLTGQTICVDGGFTATRMMTSG